MSKDIPKGLVFSTHSDKRRKRALILSFVLILLQFSMIWPIYPFFASPTPLIIGFPLSIIWVIFILLLSFTSLLVFFRGDNSQED